jgi:hypothetical protein
MKKNAPLTKNEKKLEMSAVEMDDAKKSIIAQLQKTPIVQFACERTGVGRSTYYSWRAKDIIFARAADRALEAGRFLINDLAESKLMSLLQGSNLTAIIFWLKHNHPKYTEGNKIVSEHEVATDKFSVEEESIHTHQLARQFAIKHVPLLTAEEVKEQIEDELSSAERTEADRKRIRDLMGE